MGKLALRLMIGDEEFRAIDHVAAQWAYLETQIDFVIDVLINQPSTKDSGFEFQQSFTRRMGLTRSEEPPATRCRLPCGRECRLLRAVPYPRVTSYNMVGSIS